ncbi:divergent PAP2 family protein [Facklamia sp. P12945]|uniref:divergent PAP2 family protein n=1 Tax=unclassified Facklamia TaxID=2622293 RepID=UPI003D17B73C
MNYPLIAAFTAIFFAQMIKYPIAYYSKRSPKLDIITSTGGMPSSHSAAVASLIASLIFEYGFASAHVAIATVFGVIIMFDSMGVRRQSGEQGLVIDAIVKRLSQSNYEDINVQSIKEKLEDSEFETEIIDNYQDLIVTKYLGHKPTEVFAGIITGGFVAVVMRLVFLAFFY